MASKIGSISSAVMLSIWRSCGNSCAKEMTRRGSIMAIRAWMASR